MRTPLLILTFLFVAPLTWAQTITSPEQIIPKSPGKTPVMGLPTAIPAPTAAKESAPKSPVTPSTGTITTPKPPTAPVEIEPNDPVAPRSLSVTDPSQTATNAAAKSDPLAPPAPKINYRW